MSLAREIQRRIPGIATQAVLICISLYFIYHTVEGEHGINAGWGLSQKIELANASLKALTDQRQTLEAHAALLRRGLIDPDMLDERARVLLNFGRPDEVVVPWPKDGPQP
jgi:cell division protein FtsB